MYKKLLTIGIISIFFLTSIFSLTSAGFKTVNSNNSKITLYVDDDNTEGPWDGTKQNPFREIQDAIDAAENGCLINVMCGTYDEIIVNKPGLTISGEDKEKTKIIDVESKQEYDNIVVKIQSNDITISDFTIKAVGKYARGIIANHSYDNKNTVIKNNIIILEKNPDRGVRVSNYSTISDNIFISRLSEEPQAGSAIMVDHDNTIRNNFIEGFLDGIDLFGYKNNIVQYNTLKNNWNGIMVTESSENIITYNTFYGNYYGLFLWGDTTQDNVIHHNNFLDKVDDPAACHARAICNENVWDDGKEGNYWDDYIGTDINKDGIGDTPYKVEPLDIEGINVDHKPFMEKNGWLEPPHISSISGNDNGKAGKKYMYTFSATDPYGYDLFYDIEWGDGEGWSNLGPFKSGEEFNINHTYENKGAYIVKARATSDPNDDGNFLDGKTSDWSKMKITMPKTRSKEFNLPVLKALEKTDIPLITLILDLLSAVQ